MSKDPKIKEAVSRHAVRDMANLPPEIPRPDTPRPAAPAKEKIGDEHVKGMIKLGFHELTNALAAFPDSNIRPGEEPGIFGNATMPHIQKEDDSYERSLQHYSQAAPPIGNDRSPDR